MFFVSPERINQMDSPVLTLTYIYYVGWSGVESPRLNKYLIPSKSFKQKIVEDLEINRLNPVLCLSVSVDSSTRNKFGKMVITIWVSAEIQLLMVPTGIYNSNLNILNLGPKFI